MISAHSSVDVCARCTQRLKFSASSVTKKREKAVQISNNVDETDARVKKSETLEELLDICVSNSWVKLVLATGKTFSC